jgi:hypothetical protein
MAALICRWLNSPEVGLSTTVEAANLEREFANGYLLAEILAYSKAGRSLGLLHVEDLELFRNSHHRNAAIENFTLLQPVLSKIGLVVPVDQVRRIVIQERGAISDLLFKIRSAFNSKNGKVPKVEFRKFEESIFNYNRDKKPLLPQVRVSKDLFNTIIDPNSSKQNRDSAIHLRHFEEDQNAWQKKVAYLEVDEIKAAEKKTRVKRLMEKELLKEKRAWDVKKEEEGVERWAKTQDVKVRRQRKQLEFELSIIEKGRRKDKLRRRRMGNDQKEGIEDFDRNRKRLGVGGDEEEELPEDPDVLKINRITPIEHLGNLKQIVAVEKKALAAPARNYMKKLHTKRLADQVAQKEREARQRKQEVDQKKAQSNAAQGKEEAGVLLKLVNSAEAERAEGHQRWLKKHKEHREATKRQEIINLHTEKYTSSINSYFTKYFEDSATRAAETKGTELAVRKRLAEERSARQAMKLKEHTSWINKFVQQLAGIALIVVEAHEKEARLGREPVIGAKEWRILRTDFVKGNLSTEILMGVSDSMLGGMDITSEHQLDLADFDDFCKHARAWCPAESVRKVILENEEASQAFSKKIPTVLDEFATVLKSLSGTPAPPKQITNLGPSVIGIAILGGPLLGKSTVVDNLAYKYRLKAVSITKTLEMAMKFSKSEADPVVPLEEHLQNLKEEILVLQNTDGGDEPNAFSYAKLIDSRNLAFALVEQIVEADKCSYPECGGWLCDGWPVNLEQARLLEFKLRGPICEGVLDQDPTAFLDIAAAGKKWNPPEAPVGTVLNTVVIIQPPDDMDEEALERAEIAVEQEEEDEEAEVVGVKFQRDRAQNLNVNPITAAVLSNIGDDAGVPYPLKESIEDWNNRNELILEWYDGRCPVEDVVVESQDSIDHSIPYCPTRLGLEVEVIMEGAYQVSCNRLPVQHELDVTTDANGEKEGAAGEGERESGSNMIPEYAMERSASPTCASKESILWSFERAAMENAVRQGLPPLKGRKIASENIEELQKTFSFASEKYKDGALDGLRRLRDLSVSRELFWSDVRSNFRMYLQNNKPQKRLVAKIGKKISGVGDLTELPAEKYQRAVSKLQEFASDTIDALYGLTTKKQDDSEDRIDTVKQSRWESNFAGTAEKAFLGLLEAASKKLREDIAFAAAFYDQVEGPYKNELAEKDAKVEKVNSTAPISPGLDAIYEWKSLQKSMPKFWSKLQNMYNSKSHTAGANTAGLQELVSNFEKDVVILCSYAHANVEGILSEGRDNLNLLDRWMGEIINFESTAVAEYSYLVRGAVDALSRGDQCPNLELSYTPSIEDTEVPITVLDGKAGRVTQDSFSIETERVKAVVRKLREVASKGKSPLNAPHFLPKEAFVNSIVDLITEGVLGAAWERLSTDQLQRMADVLDPADSGKVYWREFIQCLLCSLIPNRCLPTPLQLCKMYNAFVLEDEASPTLSSKESVEWSDYTRVQLWFERERRPGEEVEGISVSLGQSLRDLYWYIWVGAGGGSSSGGVLHYPTFLFHLCLDPINGPGEMRSLGLHKAWVLMSEMKGRKDQKLTSQNIGEMMNVECFNPRFTKTSRLFTSEEIHDNIAIDHQTFLKRAKEQGWFEEANMFPYALKDVFRVM